MLNCSSDAELQPNPDISGIGVLIGFVGTAYITLILLVLRYVVGSSPDVYLDIDGGEYVNPIDRGVLRWIWKRMGGQPSRRWGPAIRNVSGILKCYVDQLKAKS
ncbi:hypothetical protein B0A49_04999 [Cryomyces minteri]|uniref:Uncharacterized protein n=1 Tax=Cryomyces minteri TaxID=331657 RepID=A0A4U0XBQ8_9PEZI|nr:hypothetical protein B0A49_04999 [Cryomyces minteri]